MANETPQFEQVDITGRTIHKNGPFSTTPTLIPASPVAGEVIAEVLINTQEMTATSQRLLVSFDGGTTYMQFKKNTIAGWFVRGQTQIYVKGSAASVPGELVVNLEET
jgi:hypothetical protein